MKNLQTLVDLYHELKRSYKFYNNHKTVYDQLRGMTPQAHNLHEERTHKLQPKIDKHFQLVTNAMIRKKNAQEKWEKAMKKLTETDKHRLELAIFQSRDGVQ